MEAGFITISRKLLSWEWADDPLMGWLWVQLLLRANHEANKWHGIVVERGQLVTSLAKLTTFTGISARGIRTRLERLSEAGCIDIKTTNKYTVITICKYDSYQRIQDNSDKQTTIKRQSNDKQTTTNNNDNNDNKDNIIPSISPKGDATKKAKKPLVEREQEFYQTIIPYVGQYGAEMCRAFFDYWREPYRNKDKMRWEGQKTWAVNLRLATWAKREKKDGRYQDFNSEGERERRLRQAASVMQDLIENGIPT